MGRPLRIEHPDVFYHITARGNERKNIFKSNRDRERFLGYLGSASERYKAIVHSYSLMDNQVLCGAPHKKCYVKFWIMWSLAHLFPSLPLFPLPVY